MQWSHKGKFKFIKHIMDDIVVISTGEFFKTTNSVDIRGCNGNNLESSAPWVVTF